jgi:hypothetical protein
MEQTEIKALLEKYWQADSSLEEERLLAEYFRQVDIPAELEPMRGLFEWREEEASVRPGADFDRRMLERIAEIEDAGSVDSRRGFAIRFAAAAAIVLCFGIGLLIPRISPGPGAQGGSGRPVAAITDTYTDPQQALAEVKRALLVASVRMNKGTNITQKNITRLHDSWRVAIGD